MAKKSKEEIKQEKEAKRSNKKEVFDDEQKKANKELAQKAIVKKYGNVLSTLGEHKDIKIRTVPSGSISLDVALGRGGFALGRIYEIFGPNSGGKSTLAASVVVQAQKRGLTCCYVDAEHAVDPVLFRNYGVSNDLELVQGYDGEDNLMILEELVGSGAYDVAVIDSVSSLIPKAEAEGDLDDEFMGLLSRLMSKTCRRFTPLVNRSETLLIFINQIRMKIGGYGNPETTTGGNALLFYSTGRICLRGPESKDRRIISKEGKDTIGHRAEFEVVKNKLAPPFKKGEIPLIYGVGFDTVWETLSISESLGVVDRAGAWYKYKGENIGNGEENTLINLRGNKELYGKIYDDVITSVGLKAAYEWNV